MIKLKNILAEGFAWERKEGKGLPTLAEVQAEYESKMAGTAKPIDEYDLTNVKDFGGEGFASGARDPKTGNLYDTGDSEENDDVYLAANEAHEATSEDGRTETISAKRAAAELKQYIKGKRSDGMGAYTATIYGINDAGKKVKITSQDQLSKFKTFGLTDKDEPVNANEKPDYIDADNDGNEDESMKDAFKDKNENINESFIGRLKKNLIGGAVRK